MSSSRKTKAAPPPPVETDTTKEEIATTTITTTTKEETTTAAEKKKKAKLKADEVAEARDTSFTDYSDTNPQVTISGPGIPVDGTNQGTGFSDSW